MSHVSDPPTYQILQDGSESFSNPSRYFWDHLRLLYKGKDLNTETRQKNKQSQAPTSSDTSTTVTEHCHTSSTHHLDIPHPITRIILPATMHYAVPIAILASLATIGLADDSGPSSRCGISLFIGDGSPPCNVNTSNKSGGHGQSADLTINGDCVPQAGQSFGATVNSHFPYLLSLRVS